MINKRDLSNLGSENDGEKTIELVRDYFTNTFLCRKGGHPLQVLWSRPDRLATVELYILGKCLEKFSGKNIDWLNATIKDIRKSKDDCQGLLTEILYFGFYSLFHSTIEPAPNKKSGYDFRINYPNKTSQIISVKKIGISKPQNQFQADCRKLRRRWIEHIKYKKLSMHLQISSPHPLSTEHFDSIWNKIVTQGATKKTILCNEIKIGMFMIQNHDGELSPWHTSDTVFVHCPSPDSERTRYAQKLRKAVSNINKHTTSSETESRIIFFRAHSSADYNFIAEKVKAYIESPQNGVDAIIFYQPTYCRDENGYSLLHHCLKMEASPKLACQMGGADYFKVTIPIGSFSTTQSSFKLMTDTGDLNVAASDYIFQQGDIYQMLNLNLDGSMHGNIGSPWPGIKMHAVFIERGQRQIIKPKFPETDDLLII